MKKINVGFFITLLILLYVFIFSLITMVVVSIFPENLFSNFVFAVVLTTILQGMASFISIFSLRSCYVLPASPLKITAILVIIWLVLNIFSAFFVKSIDIPAPTLMDSIVTIIINALFVYTSLIFSDRYFLKKS